MAKDIQKLARRLKARVLESRILKDLETLEQNSKNREEFLQSLQPLIQKITRADYCFLILKENSHFQFPIAEFPAEYNEELFLTLTQNLLETNKPLAFNVTRKHKQLKQHKIRSLHASPIRSPSLEGALILANKYKRNFLKLDIWKLVALSKALAKTLDKTQLREELTGKSKELEIITRINELQETITDNQKLISAILREVQKETSSQLAYFYLKGKDQFQVVGKSKESLFIKNNQSTLIRLAKETLSLSEIHEFGPINDDIQNGLCSPFTTDESHGTIGIINTTLNDHNRRVIQTVAKQISSAVSQDQEKNRLKKAFGRYVSPEVIEGMLKNKEKDYMKTKKDEVTILFSDIRGFTKLSETLPPEKIVEMMNEHFNIMTEIILKHKGMVDKFIGDAIMAVWGAPIYLESHALKAVKAALEMQKAQQKLESKYKKEKIPFTMGIGLNTGEAIIGNIGSDLKTDYTVVGDTVNTASRICSSAKENQIFISESTLQETQKSIKTKKLPLIEVKNKTKPLQLYEVIGLKR